MDPDRDNQVKDSTWAGADWGWSQLGARAGQGHDLLKYMNSNSTNPDQDRESHTVLIHEIKYWSVVYF